MKKMVSVLLMVACIIGLQTACNKNAPFFALDASGNYTGFSNLPELKDYTAQDAEEDGYFVMQDIKVIANQPLWDSFIETAAEGNNAGIRIASFYTNEAKSPFFSDLFFNDGHYYLFDNSDDNQKEEPFSYLLTLEGEWGNPLKDSRYVVLTNDNKLTFQKYTKALYSSNLEVIKSIEPYRLIMF